jgi:hypothetical protein
MGVCERRFSTGVENNVHAGVSNEGAWFNEERAFPFFA